MVRGIERTALFRDRRDRDEFVRRLGAVVAAGGAAVYAWALLPNHVHLLLRTGRAPLARLMRALLTGYAGAFNRRHKRAGHLFQNRYKSIVVEEEPYFLELVRYLHLNPLRAHVVADFRVLDRYAYSGHAVLLGRRKAPWQDTAAVLGRFGASRRHARERYRAFVAEGLRQGRRPDLQGGGLRRSAGGWAGVSALRRGRERWATDERILGSGPFVESLRQEVAQSATPWPRAQALVALPHLIAAVAARWNLPPAALSGGARRRPIPTARAAVCALACTHLGLPAATVARALSVSLPAVLQAVPRGHARLAGHEKEFLTLLPLRQSPAPSSRTRARSVA
jgi:REP element-mobilizing transposase RayT